MATDQTPEPSNVVLQRFFESSEAARQASSPLKKAAAVAVRFPDVPGVFHFKLIDGKPRFSVRRAEDPDFELTMAPGAVSAIAARGDAVVGDLGSLCIHHLGAP